MAAAVQFSEETQAQKAREGGSWGRACRTLLPTFQALASEKHSSLYFEHREDTPGAGLDLFRPSADTQRNRADDPKS